MTVGINQVAYIEYFTADQDSETQFDNRALDQMLSEDELADIVASDIERMKQKSAADYYAAGTGEGDSDNAGGTLFKVVLSPEKEAKIRTVKEGGLPTIGHGLRILDDFASGTKIPTSVVRRLSEGVDPSTRETLSKKTKSYFDKLRHHPEKLIDKNGEKLKTPRLGYDLTFSIDKAASVLWADLRLQAEKTGDMRLVRKIENLVEASAAKSIQLMYDNDVFKTRRTITNPVLDPETGKMKQVRTEYLEPVLDITSALYLHKSARPTGNGRSNGDPQLHVHALVFNSVVRQDGTIGALENSELMRMRPVMDAAFKTAFYEGLLQIDEFKHLDIIKRDKVVDIGGIDQKLIQEFSARREEILDELEAMEMPATREATTIAAKNTRRTKDEQPNVQGLLPEWEAKISQYSKDGIYADTKKHQRDVLEETYEEKLERLALEAIERIGGHQTIVSERDLLAEATRVCIGERGIGFDGIKDVVSHLKTSHLIIAEPDDRQEITWAIKHLADKEIQFLLDIKNSEKMQAVFSSDEIATRLKELEDQHKADPKNVRLMNEGQVGMFEYVLSSEDQVICVEGSAGTGKTTTMQNINIGFKEKDFNTWGLSPSWKAAGGLGNELGLDSDKFFAVTKFINMLKPFTDASGCEIPAKVKLTSKDVIYVDESGMLGIEDAQFLLSAVKEANAKLVLIGDTLQLAPVAAGDPLSMAIRVNGGYRLDTIVRQHNPASEESIRLTARMREASALFVESGKSGINKNTEGSRADAENMSDEMKAASKKGKTGDPHIGVVSENGK